MRDRSRRSIGETRSGPGGLNWPDEAGFLVFGRKFRVHDYGRI
jgi:hypothetical protein